MGSVMGAKIVCRAQGDFVLGRLGGELKKENEEVV